MTAQDFANGNENVVVWYAGNGSPAGVSVALLEGTELPFDLSEVQGEVEEDGDFTCTDYKDGDGVWDWRFKDHSGNLIYKIRLHVWPEEFSRQENEWLAVG